ncbi:hypothetical protein Tco_0869007 [Tanacetum coccineum]
MLLDCCNLWSSLIPLSRGSFDVILGHGLVDSNGGKFVIVGHVKVVRIPPRWKSMEEHEVHLMLVLESLRKEKMYAKFSKSNVVGDCVELEKDVSEIKDDMCKDEAHASRYLVHPGADKKYINLGDIPDDFLSENEIEPPWILSLNLQDNSKEWNSGDDQLRLRWMIYLVVLADAAESVWKIIIEGHVVIEFGGSYHLSIRCAPFEALYGRKCRSPVLWAEIGESSLTGLELVQETTDKVVLVKEKPKAVKDR